jgi:predicted enzyme related to lactoylglutathione lyase
MSDATGRFIWYELMTTDANAAARFYGAVTGWKIADRPDPRAGGLDYRQITRDDDGSAGGVLQPMSDMQAHGARPVWLAYPHLRNVDAAMQAIVADDGRAPMPKMTLPVGEIAMVADPMGAPFYVMTPVPPPGKPDARSDVFDTTRPQHVRWNALRCPDVARAKAFHARHFGFEFIDSMPMGAEHGAGSGRSARCPHRPRAPRAGSPDPAPGLGFRPADVAQSPGAGVCGHHDVGIAVATQDEPPGRGPRVRRPRALLGPAPLPCHGKVAAAGGTRIRARS